MSNSGGTWATAICFAFFATQVCFEGCFLAGKTTVKPETPIPMGYTGYGFSQVYFHMFHISWWIQKAMGFHRLWVITVWVISGLTVANLHLFKKQLAFPIYTLNDMNWRVFANIITRKEIVL